MKLTDDNVTLMKTEKGYSIKIEMPDGSRNYIHSQDFSLFVAIQFRDDIIGLQLDKESIQIKKIKSSRCSVREDAINAG